MGEGCFPFLRRISLEEQKRRTYKGMSVDQPSAGHQRGLRREEALSPLSGASAAFIIISGAIFSVTAFIVLYFVTVDLKSQEARNLTRDMVRVTQQTVTGLENFTASLARYMAFSAEGPDEAALAFIREGFAEMRAVDHLLWLTPDHAWYRRSLEGGKLADHSDWSGGLPGWDEVQDRAGQNPSQKTGVWTDVPWAGFLPAAGETVERPVVFFFRTEGSDGKPGVMLVVARPSRIFSSALNTRRDDLAGLYVKDQESGDALLTTRYSMARGGGVTGEVPADYVMTIGDGFWKVSFTVFPTRSTILLSLMPWIVPAVMMLLTLIAALLVYRKARRDGEMARIEKNLAVSRGELESRITERDRLFTALKKSEREHKALINCISEIIFEVDPEGRFIFLNEAWQRVTGIEPEKALRRSLFDLLPADEQVSQSAMFEELLTGRRQAYRVETHLRVESGAYKSVELAFSMVRMGEDGAVRAVGTITDIEKRRQAEEAVRKVQHRYREIVENSISGLYQTTPEGKFISANPALAKMLGYESADELMACVTDVGRQIYVSEAARKEFVYLMSEEGVVTSFEVELYRQDGSKIWALESARAIRGDRGEILYYEGSLLDVTDRKRTHEALVEAKVQAEVSSRARMDFLANMSHELRTPLNAIIGFSEIIKNEVMGTIGNPAYKEYARDIYESGNSLFRIITDILEVSKIESGNRELNESVFSLKNTVRSCLAILQGKIEAAKHCVTVEIVDDMPDLRGEELGIRQVLINVVGNAIKFTPAGGNIAIRACIAENGCMHIDVTDNGPGMTEDEVKKALQPFGQVETAHSRGTSGTGLGLTIVQSLLKLHGGHLELISEKGRGTTARLVLPKERVFIPARKKALKSV